SEEGWKFSRNEIPQFPQSISDFYFQQLPVIAASEQSLLELISAAEIAGGIGLLSADSFDSDALRALVDKQVLTNHNGKIRFRNPQVAEAIYSRMDSARMQSAHRWWSEKLQNATPSVAQHLIRAGDYREALKIASKASVNAMLPVFQALTKHSDELHA